MFIFILLFHQHSRDLDPYYTFHFTFFNKLDLKNCDIATVVMVYRQVNRDRLLHRNVAYKNPDLVVPGVYALLCDDPIGEGAPLPSLGCTMERKCVLCTIAKCKL